jgi:hypothetical protein
LRERGRSDRRWFAADLLKQARVNFAAGAGRSASPGDLLGASHVGHGEGLAGPSFVVEGEESGFGVFAVGVEYLLSFALAEGAEASPLAGVEEAAGVFRGDGGRGLA